MKSRIITTLIAGSMVLGFVPVQAFAVTEGNTINFNASTLVLENGEYDIRSELKDEVVNKSMEVNIQMEHIE